MRCLICGHVRTRLDPLPDTARPECGTPYAVAQQKVESGLVKPAPTPAQRVVRKPDSVRLRAAGVVLLAGAVLAPWYLGREDPLPVGAREALRPAALSDSIPPDRLAEQPGAATAQPEVVVYMTTWCKVCARTRHYLSSRGIRFTERDVERSAQGWHEYRQYSGDGVPLVVIGDQVMRGYNERWLEARLGPWLRRRGG